MSLISTDTLVTTTHSPCPVCGGFRFRVLGRCKDYLVSGEEFSLHRCVDCGFIQTGNPPNAENLGAYYKSKNYMPHSDTSRGVTSTLFRLARNRMLKQKISWVERSLGGMLPSSLLDVGAGTGYFADQIRRLDCDVVAVEVDDDARALVAQRIGLDRSFAHISALPKVYEKDAFQVITLWHVLEHIPDLDAHLSAFYQMLKPGGALVLALPNSTSFDARHYKRMWAAYDVPRHLWHFSFNTLSALVSRYGFALSSVHPMYLDAFYVSILSEQNRKNTRSGMAFCRGIGLGLRSLYASLRNKNLASSLVYILHKS